MQIAQITNMRDGEVLATIVKHYGIETQIPVDDGRLARVVVDLWDPALAHVFALTRCLKVFYDKDLVFNGIISGVSWNNEEASRAVIHAQDSSFRLKHRHLGFGDEAVDDGYGIDGPGLWSLIEAAEPTPAQLALDPPVPGTGIVLGEDTSNAHIGPLHKANRGQNIWDEWISKMELSHAPHWNMRPIDENNPGAEADWAPGLMVELSFYANRIVDRREDVIFHDGFGRDNCTIGIDDDGGAVVNYEVRTAMAGQSDPDEPSSRTLSLNLAKMQEQGIMQAWTSTDYATDSEAKDEAAQEAFLEKIEPVLQAEGDAIVEGYSDVPQFFTITLAQQAAPTPEVTSEEPYRYLAHFTEGDRVRGYVKRGYLQRMVEGRIRKVTLSDDETGATTTALEVVPTVLPSDID